jgi:hypothetical protein
MARGSAVKNNLVAEILAFSIAHATLSLLHVRQKYVRVIFDGFSLTTENNPYFRRLFFDNQMLSKVSNFPLQENNCFLAAPGRRK